MISEKAKFNKVKFKEAILYLISLYPKDEIEGKKKLAKLLYFADFNYFEIYDTSITGASYRALPMGPVPDQLREALKEMQGKTITRSLKDIGFSNKLEIFRIKTREYNFKHLTEKEKSVLKKVHDDYGKFSGKKLENLTHSEAPYNAVVQNEHMPYELSYYRGNTKEELMGA